MASFQVNGGEEMTSGQDAQSALLELDKGICFEIITDINSK